MRERELPYIFQKPGKMIRVKFFWVKERSTKLPSWTDVNYIQKRWIPCRLPTQLVSCSSCNSLRNMQVWTAFSRRQLPVHMPTRFFLQLFLLLLLFAFPQFRFPLQPRSPGHPRIDLCITPSCDHCSAFPCQLVPHGVARALPAVQHQVFGNSPSLTRVETQLLGT